jgi:uncharacterized protein (DUF362 family)
MAARRQRFSILTRETTTSNKNARVGLVHYDKPDEPRISSAERAASALAALSSALEWGKGDESGAFGNMIPDNAAVVVKPNWVSHINHSGHGLSPMITDSALVRRIVEEALKSGAQSVLVGDAPIQSCNFPRLMKETGLDQWASDLARREARFRGVRDFRRLTAERRHGTLVQHDGLRPLSDFVLFDLGSDSLLESVTSNDNRFRVTQYDPSKLEATHSRGRHRYLVAREIVEADVVINVPKLKTHQKAGVTCALKNLVGINGDKAFLPHHRIRSATEGGDCYPSPSLIKRFHEVVLDYSNRQRSHFTRTLLTGISQLLSILARSLVDQIGVEGSWAGNDTVWRMALDLNRIVLYGRTDGRLDDRPQRRLLCVVDAGIAGQGYGPLAPEEFPLGILAGAESSATVDWVCAQLMGYVPERLPIVDAAFDLLRWPIGFASANDILVVGDAAQEFREGILPLPEAYPLGWLPAVEKNRGRPKIVGRSSARPSQVFQSPAFSGE